MNSATCGGVDLSTWSAAAAARERASRHFTSSLRQPTLCRHPACKIFRKKCLEEPLEPGCLPWYSPRRAPGLHEGLLPAVLLTPPPLGPDGFASLLFPRFMLSLHPKAPPSPPPCLISYEALSSPLRALGLMTRAPTARCRHPTSSSPGCGSCTPTPRTTRSCGRREVSRSIERGIEDGGGGAGTGDGDVETGTGSGSAAGAGTWRRLGRRQRFPTAFASLGGASILAMAARHRRPKCRHGRTFPSRQPPSLSLGPRPSRLPSHYPSLLPPPSPPGPRRYRRRPRRHPRQDACVQRRRPEGSTGAPQSER